MNVQQHSDEYWKSHSQQLEARHKLALAQIGSVVSILDVGAGDGLFLSHVDANVKLGLEISPQACIKSKESVIVFDFSKEELPTLEGEKYKVVTALDVLEHTLTPVDLLKKMGKVGEQIVITVPNFAFITHRLSTFFGGIPSVNNERKAHCFYFTKNKLEQVFERAGLEIISWSYYFPLDNRNNGFLRWFFKLRPCLFATEFCVKAEVKKHERPRHC